MPGHAGHGDWRRDSEKDQDRRHEKAAAYAEHARDEAHQRAGGDQQGGVDGDFGDGEIDVQQVRPPAALEPVPFRRKV